MTGQVIRDGDELTVRGIASARTVGVVTASREMGLHLVRFAAGTPHEKEVWLPRSDIVGHRPRPIQAGDRVRLLGHPGDKPWPVIAIHAGWAWLGDVMDSGLLKPLAALERVND